MLQAMPVPYIDMAQAGPRLASTYEGKALATTFSVASQMSLCLLAHFEAHHMPGC